MSDDDDRRLTAADSPGDGDGSDPTPGPAVGTAGAETADAATALLMSRIGSGLLEEATDWIRADPDPATKFELADLLKRASTAGSHAAVEDLTAGSHAAVEDLEDRFDGTLEFGTAGLRGRLGAGPNRMNRAVVIRTAAGLASYLSERLASSDRPPRVVIGYDARQSSARFAADTAAVLTAARAHALLMPRALPVPVLAYAVQRFEADAGVMISAGCAPAGHSGYKVYLGAALSPGFGQGAQVVPPHDAEIARRIQAAPPARDVPRAAIGWTLLDEEVVQDYVQSVLALGAVEDVGPLRIVHTALHGVGGELVTHVLEQAGFTDVHPVVEQADPDPDFPTLARPDPQDPRALEAATALATRLEADLVIASDPDVARCAVLCRDPHREGRLRLLTGDEVGALLGAEMARRAQMRTWPEDAIPVLANSVVSSRLLARIASRYGMDHALTLTGFKWISRVPNLLFGYEEARGYCCDPGSVRDKDGIAAALLVARLAARFHAGGRTLVDALDDLARAEDLYATAQVAVPANPSERVALMDGLRRATPLDLAGSPVTMVCDLIDGWAGLPPADAVLWLAADGTRVIVRPSGTEPTVRCYLEVVVPTPADADRAALGAVRARARERLEELSAQMRDLMGMPQ